MPYDFTIDDANQLEAGLELNWRASEAASVWVQLNAMDAEASWPFPGLWSERLRRQLGLPPPIPNGWPTYAGTYTPDYSGDAALAYQTLEAMGHSEGYSEFADPVEMTRLILTATMSRLGMN